MARLMSGERPVEEVTPDWVLALHDAGYREVGSRLGEGVVVDLGCGLGFETVRLSGPGRTSIGLDYDQRTAAHAAHRWRQEGLRVARADCAQIGIRSRSIDWVCSSHIIEHFAAPARHVAEAARVLRPGGTAFFLTPNRPFDFENPFHLVLFDVGELRSLLSEHFADVWIGGLNCSEELKAEIRERRAKASRVYAVDVFGLRHAMPRSWWRWIYGKLLPVATETLYPHSLGRSTGITEKDFFLCPVDEVDATTPALFAVARAPLRLRRAA